MFVIEQAVVGCMRQAYLIATTILHPGMQLYVLRLALKATVTAVNLVKGRATEADGKLIVNLLHSLVYVCRMNPFWSFPLVTVSEAVLLNIMSGKLHSQYCLDLQSKEKKPIRNAELKYQIYENNLRRVCHIDDEQDGHFDDLHFNAMQEMLVEKGWSCVDVSRLMTSPLSARSKDGWLKQSHTLGVSLPYSELQGFSVKFGSTAQTTSIRLLLNMADDKAKGLFAPDDVSEVLSFRPGGSWFSLEHPSRNENFHPFQEFKYEPEELKDTAFLHTMFETDYLLKSFSVGVEVSAKPPFKQRPNERLLENLPAHLRHILRPMFERGSLFPKAHRFWIQADELVYTRKVDSLGSGIEYRLGEPRMVIRSHPLIPGVERKLQDAPEGDISETPEAKFAADFTTHYDEIAHYFPLFARLKELVKLQFFACVIQSTMENLKKYGNRHDTVTDSTVRTIQEEERRKKTAAVSLMLCEIKSKIGVWPSAENESEVSSAVWRIRAELSSSYSHADVRYSDIESDVRKVLRQNDRKVLSDIVGNLMQLCHSGVSRNSMETYVSRWLSSYDTLEYLVQFVDRNLCVSTRAKIQQEIAEHYKVVYRLFAQEVSAVIGRNQHCRKAESSCNWVPAAMMRHSISDSSYSLCYGGVLLAPVCREGVARDVRRSANIRNISGRDIHSFKVKIDSSVTSTGSVTANREMTSKSSVSRRGLSSMSAGSASSNFSIAPTGVVAGAGNISSSSKGQSGHVGSGKRANSNTTRDVVTKRPIASEIYSTYVETLHNSKISLANMAGCLTSFLRNSFQEITDRLQTSFMDVLPNPAIEKIVLGGQEKHFQKFVAERFLSRLPMTSHELLWNNNLSSSIIPNDDQLAWSNGFQEWILKGRVFPHSGRPDFVIVTFEPGGGVSYTILELKVCHRSKDNTYNYYGGKSEPDPEERLQMEKFPNGLRSCQSLKHLIRRAECQVQQYSQWWSSMLKDHKFSSPKVFYQVAIGVQEKEAKAKYVLTDIVQSERKRYVPCDKQ